MIMPGHVAIWRKVLSESLPATGRWITIGVQDIHERARAEVDFQFQTVTSLLQSKGITVQTLDLFDARADIRHDLNAPLPAEWRGAFDVLMDVGTLEHVFDTRQAFINYLDLVRQDGWLFLHLPVSGYYRHGLHTFSPELIRSALCQNGCRITCEIFSDYQGNLVEEEHLRGVDALLWIIVQKVSPMAKFHIPQQSGWRDYYEELK